MWKSRTFVNWNPWNLCLCKLSFSPCISPYCIHLTLWWRNTTVHREIRPAKHFRTTHRMFSPAAYSGSEMQQLQLQCWTSLAGKTSEKTITPYYSNICTRKFKKQINWTFELKPLSMFRFINDFGIKRIKSLQKLDDCIKHSNSHLNSYMKCPTLKYISWTQLHLSRTV